MRSVRVSVVRPSGTHEWGGQGMRQVPIARGGGFAAIVQIGERHAYLDAQEARAMGEALLLLADKTDSKEEA